MGVELGRTYKLFIASINLPCRFNWRSSGAWLVVTEGDATEKELEIVIRTACLNAVQNNFQY